MKIGNKEIKFRSIKFTSILFIILGILIILGIVLSINTYYLNTDNEKILGKNNLGTVSLEGPFGNINSSDKIAFIIGVHPLESNSHKSLINTIRNNDKNLNKSYYIYKINVTKDKNDFSKGRMNGQLLAKEYVVEDIKNKSYDFVVDVHSHRGVYVEKNFIISPLNDSNSTKIALNIIENIENMKFLKYIPADDGDPTSPEYVSIPILKNGTPTIIYETYLNESETITNNFMEQFIKNLDNYVF